MVLTGTASQQIFSVFCLNLPTVCMFADFRRCGAASLQVYIIHLPANYVGVTNMTSRYNLCHTLKIYRIWDLWQCQWKILLVMLLVCPNCLELPTCNNVFFTASSRLKTFLFDSNLTLSPPIPLRLYTLPYWSNAPFLIFDIRALWRSGLSARVPECQKLKIVG